MGAGADAGTEGSEKISALEGQFKSLEESYLETKGTVDKLAKIKLSGYIQAQWQHADSNGQASIAGGSFPANTKQRFQVRRGRLKTTYAGETSLYVLQFDVIPRGVSIKDAYVALQEPWLKAFSATMGVFDRPFGFEISYSSSSRESPERSRVYQTLFPGERDLGAKLEFKGHENLGFLQYFNLKGGVFTGQGPTADEIDEEQDFIGRLGFQAPFYDLNLGIDGGFSAYMGKVLNLNDTAYAMDGSAFDTTFGNRLKQFDRNVMGVDAQLYYDIPVIGGLSLRGEYLWGEMPGTRGSSGPYGAATSPLATRNVMGWYGMAVQNLGPRVQAVVKYDVYDPNTDVEASDIGRSGSNLNAADIQYSTLGLGLTFYWDDNIRFIGYYDVVRNEEIASTSGSLLPYSKDLNDNVFTFRMQAKF
jgi:hypothetical protein